MSAVKMDQSPITATSKISLKCSNRWAMVSNKKERNKKMDLFAVFLTAVAKKVL